MWRNVNWQAPQNLFAMAFCLFMYHAMVLAPLQLPVSVSCAVSQYSREMLPPVPDVWRESHCRSNLAQLSICSKMAMHRWCAAQPLCAFLVPVVDATCIIPQVHQNCRDTSSMSCGPDSALLDPTKLGLVSPRTHCVDGRRTLLILSFELRTTLSALGRKLVFLTCSSTFLSPYC